MLTLPKLCIRLLFSFPFATTPSSWLHALSGAVGVPLPYVDETNGDRPTTIVVGRLDKAGDIFCHE